MSIWKRIFGKPEKAQKAPEKVEERPKKNIYAMTTEDYEIAEKLCSLLRETQQPGDDADKEIINIGYSLNSNGGHDRMKAVGLYVYQHCEPKRLGLGSLLDMKWNGIGSWGRGY